MKTNPRPKTPLARAVARALRRAARQARIKARSCGTRIQSNGKIMALEPRDLGPIEARASGQKLIQLNPFPNPADERGKAHPEAPRHLSRKPIPDDSLPLPTSTLQ